MRFTCPLLDCVRLEHQLVESSSNARECSLFGVLGTNCTCVRRHHLNLKPSINAFPEVANAMSTLRQQRERARALAHERARELENARFNRVKSSRTAVFHGRNETHSVSRCHRIR